MRERRSVLEVVRHEERRETELVEELAQVRPDPGTRMRVERRERLVEEEQRGVACESARQRDPLALTARELRDARTSQAP